MDKKEELSKVAREIAKCRRCPLYKSATNPVAGEGNHNAKVFFIGEAPGFYEDQQSRPFVGNAGRLLNQCLELINLKREDVFISNILKHRPPQNRDPSLVEIEACNVWLDQQLAIIKPKIVVTLGRFSMTKFLPGQSITKIHGRLFKIGRYAVFPLFHPAAALRNPQVEILLKEDFKKIPTLLLDKSEKVVDLQVPDKSDQLNLL